MARCHGAWSCGLMGCVYIREAVCRVLSLLGSDEEASSFKTRQTVVTPFTFSTIDWSMVRGHLFAAYVD